MQNQVESITRFPHLQVQPFAGMALTQKPGSDFINYEVRVESPGVSGGPSPLPQVS